MFWQGEKEITLQGVLSSELDVIEGNLMQKLWQIKEIIYILSLNMYGDSEDLQKLLDEFAVSFEMPSGLPPKRFYHHQIPLIDPNISVSS